VAEIVEETMHNYLLMGHILQCKLLGEEEIHPELWIGSGQKWRSVKYERVERQRFNQVSTIYFICALRVSYEDRIETVRGATGEGRAQIIIASRGEEAQASGNGNRL
jgi:hypothetical protein